jgi:hypothetical protein
MDFSGMGQPADTSGPWVYHSSSFARGSNAKRPKGGKGFDSKTSGDFSKRDKSISRRQPRVVPPGSSAGVTGWPGREGIRLEGTRPERL